MDPRVRADDSGVGLGKALNVVLQKVNNPFLIIIRVIGYYKSIYTYYLITLIATQDSLNNPDNP